MKNRIGYWVSVVLGVVILAGMAGYPLMNRTDAASREAGAALAHERHPKIHAAIVALREAKEELKAADHDFGGHRKEALEAVDKALHQLELAREFDKK